MTVIQARPYTDPLLVLGSRNKRLSRYSYKLHGQGNFGLDVVTSDRLEADESRMSLVIPIADGNRRDGVGDLLDVTGIVTDRHRANPLVLWDHGKQVALPIALAEDPDTKEYTLVIDPMARTAKIKAFFYRGKDNLRLSHANEQYAHAVLCEQLFDMAVKGYLRGGSIGYQVIDAEQLPPDYSTGIPQGLYLKRILMLEGSLVVMPANMDTAGKLLSLPRVCGKPLSPYLVKSLTSCVQEGRELVTSGYVCKSLPSHKLTDLRSKYKKQPSADIDPEKACQILRDGQANGKPLTDAQRGMFGAACGRGKKSHTRPSVKTAGSAGEKNYSRPPNTTSKKSLAVVTQKGTETQKGDNGVDLQSLRAKYKKKSHQAKVPLRNLPSGKIPPSTWTPGRGAVCKKKSLQDIRLKYKKSKSLRRRIKSSRSGSSLIYARKKDLERMKEEATKKGLKFHHLGSHASGRERVKLTGDDSSIDEMAKMFGRPVKTNRGTKSMALNKTKDLSAKTKEMPPPEEVVQDVPPDAPVDEKALMEEPEPEVYSAQVLRRLHEDRRILLEEYDSMLKYLEHEGVRKFVHKILENMEEELSSIEDLFEEHHNDLPELEGYVRNKDLDGNEPVEEEPVEEEVAEEEVVEEPDDEFAEEEAEYETTADSTDDREEEEPSPDDVVEGMKTKALATQKSLCGPCKKGGKKSCKCAKKLKKDLTKKGDEGEDKKSMDAEEETTNMDAPGEEEPVEEKSLEDKEEKVLPDEEEKALPEQSLYEKALEIQEVKNVRGAANFLDETSKAHDWGEESRMKAYFHHKMLEPISGYSMGEKSMPGGQDWMQEEMNEPAHSERTPVHPHRVSCGMACKYLKNLSREKAFGEVHRDVAAKYYKELDGVARNYEEKVNEGTEGDPEDLQVQEEPPADAPPVEPGTMDTKSKDALAKSFLAQSKAIQELNSRLSSLSF